MSSSSYEYDSSDGNSVSDSDSSDDDEVERRPHFAASKRPRIDQQNLKSGEDRISALPDPIIVNILSLLPATKEAIRTGALSKRWRFLWTSVASLSFSHGGERASSIADTLLRCSSPKLKKFRINNVDIRRRRVPACLNKWLAAVWPFVFKTNGLISWKLLRNLKIDGSELTNDQINNMLLGSPLLETLEFCGCYGFDRIDIDSPRMRKFVLNGYKQQGKTTVLEITAPYIASLVIKGHLGLKDIVLVDVHSLLRANFEFWFSDLSPKEDTWKGILQSIQHVNELSFRKSCRKVLSLEGEHLYSAPLKCKCLRMEFTGRNDLLGLINLLQSLPDLKCLIINENHYDNRLPDLMVVCNHLLSKESVFVHLNC